ncbi:uncharacterized protein LOC125423229 [Ziziphus jujuba]|uniref:Uncharacterized protein LOC125423229 n=1 Tax=Ziziphus jujuba TaxID=326968 RepID=A0ABM3IPP5_ZIZJJ|nr:uncharacterized protein LOC125423229 [Ziziphus jujuba]
MGKLYMYFLFVKTQKIRLSSKWNSFTKPRQFGSAATIKKYLVAEDDEESVRQDRNGASKRARWTVELVTGSGSGSAIRLNSCYDKYLTASTEPFLKGLSSYRKVVQAPPPCLDSTVEWEPIIDGEHIRLRSCYSQSFLRGSGGLAPWRNSVTHYTTDETEKSSLEWDVNIVENLDIHEDTMSYTQPPPPQTPQVPSKCETPAAAPASAPAHVHPPPRQGNNVSNGQYTQIGIGATDLAIAAESLAVDILDFL